MLKADEVSLAQELERSALVSREDLRRCANAVLAARARGETVGLAALLVARGLVSPAELARLHGVRETPPLPPEPRVRASQSLVGERLGPYEIVRVLGEGGMGVVYEAREPALGRRVAIKALWLARTGARARLAIERFRREARALAALRHPNVVAAHAFGETKDVLYIAMELVEGGRSLQALIEEKAMPARKAAQVVAKIARALQAAHDAGIVHRDLKPGNVLVDEEGEPRLSDFGLALAEDDESSRLTAPGSIVGTPSYISPEQALGREATRASDLWSLGVTLYELLAGEVPFDGTERLALLNSIVVETAPPLEGVPRDLEVIVGKAMEKEPADRYATAAALASDLEAFLRGEPIAARRLSRLARLARAARRRPAPMLALAGATAILALGAVSFSRWFDEHERTTRQRADDDARVKAERPFEELLERARAIEATGDPKEALLVYQEALKLKPDDLLALAGKGRSEEALGRFVFAESTLTRTIATIGSRTDAREAAATWAAYARSRSDRLSMVGPDPAQVQREVPLALRAAEIAVSLDPSSPLALATRARIEATFHPGEESRRLVEAVKNPDKRASTELALARALLAHWKGENDVALLQARSVRAPPAAACLAAWILVSEEEREEGQALLEDLVAASPGNGSLQLVLASVYARALDLEKAEHALADALSNNVRGSALEERLAKARSDEAPKTQRELLDRAWLLLERGKPRDAPLALGFATDAARLLPPKVDVRTFVETCRVVARAHLANGHLPEAARAVALGLGEQAGQRDLLRIRLALETNDGKWSEALADSEAILGHAPGDEEIEHQRILCLVRLDKIAEAVEAADSFSHRRPKGPLGRSLPFVARFHGGRYEECVRLLWGGEESIGVSPELAAFARRLALPPLETAAPVHEDRNEDWGDGGEPFWKIEPDGSEPRERDPRRRVLGRTSLRFLVSGRPVAVVHAAPAGAVLDLSKGALVFFACAEEAAAAAVVSSPVSLALALKDAGGGELVLRHQDALSGKRGWQRFRVSLERKPEARDAKDAWKLVSTSSAFDPARVSEVAFRFEGVERPVVVWLDGITSGP
ncbi:protein kinase [bacterium]|nr:protein kinase [bacterium]